jgi:hypothetical protein
MYNGVYVCFRDCFLLLAMNLIYTMFFMLSSFSIFLSCLYTIYPVFMPEQAFVCSCLCVTWIPYMAYCLSYVRLRIYGSRRLMQLE